MGTAEGSAKTRLSSVFLLAFQIHQYVERSEKVASRQQSRCAYRAVQVQLFMILRSKNILECCHFQNLSLLSEISLV